MEWSLWISTPPRTDRTLDRWRTGTRAAAHSGRRGHSGAAARRVAVMSTAVECGCHAAVIARLQDYVRPIDMTPQRDATRRDMT